MAFACGVQEYRWIPRSSGIQSCGQTAYVSKASPPSQRITFSRQARRLLALTEPVGPISWLRLSAVLSKTVGRASQAVKFTDEFRKLGLTLCCESLRTCHNACLGQAIRTSGAWRKVLFRRSFRLCMDTLSFDMLMRRWTSLLSAGVAENWGHRSFE